MLMRCRGKEERETVKEKPSSSLHGVWKRHPFWHEDQQPLTTAEVKTFQSSIYIFISPFFFSLSCFFEDLVSLGEAKVLFAFSRYKLLHSPLRSTLLDIYFYPSCALKEKRREKRKKASMNNIPTGDGIKKHSDFHINSFSWITKRISFSIHECMQWNGIHSTKYRNFQQAFCTNNWHKCKGMHNIFSFHRITSRQILRVKDHWKNALKCFQLLIKSLLKTWCETRKIKAAFLSDFSAFCLLTSEFILKDPLKRLNEKLHTIYCFLFLTVHNILENIKGCPR